MLAPVVTVYTHVMHVVVELLLLNSLATALGAVHFNVVTLTMVGIQMVF